MEIGNAGFFWNNVQTDTQVKTFASIFSLSSTEKIVSDTFKK